MYIPIRVQQIPGLLKVSYDEAEKIVKKIKNRYLTSGFLQRNVVSFYDLCRFKKLEKNQALECLDYNLPYDFSTIKKKRPKTKPKKIVIRTKPYTEEEWLEWDLKCKAEIDELEQREVLESLKNDKR
jgi:hypothetical protein